MGSKYSPHILDPYINTWAYDLATKYPDYYRDLASKVYFNAPLAKLGQGELEKIGKGDYGSTLYAGALRNEAARGLQNLKYSYAPGVTATGYGGKNSDSIYARLLARQAENLQNSYADRLERGLPDYVNQAGGWAEAENRGLAQQGNYYQAAQNALLQGSQLRQSNMTFEKKKSFWEKLQPFVQIAGGITLGALTGGAGGALLGGLSSLSGGRPADAMQAGTIYGNRNGSNAAASNLDFSSPLFNPSLPSVNPDRLKVSPSFGTANMQSPYINSAYETAPPAMSWRPRRVSGGY